MKVLRRRAGFLCTAIHERVRRPTTRRKMAQDSAVLAAEVAARAVQVALHDAELQGTATSSVKLDIGASDAGGPGQKARYETAAVVTCTVKKNGSDEGAMERFWRLKAERKAERARCFDEEACTPDCVKDCVCAPLACICFPFRSLVNAHCTIEQLWGLCTLFGLLLLVLAAASPVVTAFSLFGLAGACNDLGDALGNATCSSDLVPPTPNLAWAGGLYLLVLVFLVAAALIGRPCSDDDDDDCKTVVALVLLCVSLAFLITSWVFAGRGIGDSSVDPDTLLSPCNTSTLVGPCLDEMRAQHGFFIFFVVISGVVPAAAGCCAFVCGMLAQSYSDFYD